MSKQLVASACRWGLILRAACVSLLALGIAGCGNSQSSRTIALHTCRLPELATAARCGTIEVAEDRSRPDGRKLAIAVAVLPANTLSPKPDPLFLFAGGPGQSADALVPVAAALDGVRRNRDLVLIDQRGTGRSAPLQCAAMAPRDPFDDISDPNAMVKAAHACVDEIRASGNADPSQYTTSAFVTDVDAVRAALGYQRINLWGGSYGTRVAQEYLRRYPDRVRSVVLDGVAPPSLRISLDIWASREAAIGAVIAACDADPQCKKVYPDLNQTLDQIRRRLAGATQVTLVDPRTGVTHTLTPSFDMVIAGLHGLVYAPEFASMIPTLLGRAALGDFAPIAAASVFFTEDASRTINPALHFAVTCAEDAPRVSAADAARVRANARAPALVEHVVAACDGWPRPAIPADFYQPLTSNAPVLLLSGGLDPVTPPVDAELVAKTLGNSKHIVAAGYGHIVSPHACAPRLIEKFIDEAGFSSLPQSCIDYFAASRRPPLFASVLEAQ